jgi:outer membrane protein TolC
VESALAQVARTNTEIATAKADQAVLVDALAVLIGQEPGSLDVEFAGYVDENAIPLPPDKVEIGEPAALIARRPDIRVAERQLAAATAQIGVAEAARFPKLSFLGLIGIGGGDPGDVLDPDNLTAIAVPRISWSFLDFGRAKRGVEQTQFARDAAAAEYDQTVLVALQDVEAALARFAQQRTTFANALRTARHLDSIAELEAQRARAGTVGRPVALEAERAALDARRVAIVARAELTRSYATLAKALGLGWRGGANAPSPIEGSNANEP